MKRISLSEQDLEKLVNNKDVDGITMDDFTDYQMLELCDGEVVKIGDIEISLQDIGYDKIVDIVMNGNYGL